MSLDPDLRLRRRVGRTAHVAAVVAVLLGTVVLLGWALDVDELKSMLPGSIRTKANAGLGMVLGGAALWLLIPGTAASLLRRRAGQFLALLLLLLGVLTLSQYISGRDVGIDQLLFHEPPDRVETLAPNRPGLPAAVSFTLLGLALLVLDVAPRRQRRVTPAQGLALAVAVVALFGLVGFAYGVQPFYRAVHYSIVSFPMSLGASVLAMGVLAARPDVGFVRLVWTRDAGGMLMRRLLLPAVLLPFLANWLRLAGERAGIYDPGFGAGASVVSLIVIFAVMIGWSAWALHRLDEQREQAHNALAAARLSAERAKQAAEEASRAKDHFLAVLSHELRTPLTAVLPALEAMEAIVPPEAREDLEMARRNVELEARLIDDLLDVTRIARGKVELHRQPVELCVILQRAAEVCMPDIEARRLHFGIKIEQPPHIVQADAARLQQVFWNLIKNAVKFTPQGGCVGVRAWAEQDECAIVEVSDSGVGIDLQALSRIFDAFEQEARATTRQFGGLGLGLAISKALVEMHGGTISARSDGKGKGAVFTVRLPVLPRGTASQRVTSGRQPQEGAGGDGRQAPADDPRPLRILLVEDHGDTARIMKRLLTAAGHEVQHAGDVATARALATAAASQEQPFDLLVSDLGLPDGSGHDLMRQLRGQVAAGVALSGYGTAADLQQSRDAGFSEHLTKPVNLRALEEAIVRVTASRPAGLPSQ